MCTHIASSYADDSQLYLSFKPNHLDNEITALLAMQSCVAEVREWMHNDKLVMNDGKTELIIINTKQQLHHDNITMADSKIKSTRMTTKKHH